VIPREIDRRRALGLLGAGIGTAAIVACGGSGDGDEASPRSDATAATFGDTTGGTTSPTGAAAAGAAVTADMFAGAASCRLTPSGTEGPYYIDVDRIRGDIREDREGIRLRLAARVLDSDGCTPIKDAVFDVWHCDAGGLYSGLEAASRGQGGGRSSSDTTRYLRGAQITNADGIAELTTVYPGWYGGRTVHIHAKVLISNRDVLTTQLYFDDKLTDTVYAAAPYSSRPNRDRRNSSDSIFDERTVLTVSTDGDGYLGLITIGVRR
jgi:protocatechuate 3,4-dioxygenase beta subunit